MRGFELEFEKLRRFFIGSSGRLSNDSQLGNGRGTTMECSTTFDGMVEYEDAVQDARAATASQNGRMTTFRTANAKSMRFKGLLNHGDDVLVCRQTAIGMTRQRGNLGLNR